METVRYYKESEAIETVASLLSFNSFVAMQDLPRGAFSHVTPPIRRCRTQVPKE